MQYKYTNKTKPKNIRAASSGPFVYLYKICDSVATSYKPKASKGQLLIESLVAITVIAIAILGIFTLSSRSISLNRVVSDQYTGTYLAAEGIEVVKNIIDSNVVYRCQGWNTGVNTTDQSFMLSWDTQNLEPHDGDNLYFQDGLYNNKDNGTQTRFYRDIKLYENSANSVKVVSKVSWTGRGSASFDVILEDVFYNWRPFADNCL